MGLLSRAGIKTPVPGGPSAAERESFPGTEGGLLKQGQIKKTAHTISPQGVMDGIGAYCGSSQAFQCIVFEMPDEYRDSAEFSGVLSGIVGALGLSLPLPCRFSLVLVPGDFDHELLAHRLSKSLKIRAPLQFRANSPAEAMKHLHAYL
ncbi:MAG: hypothetical protein LBK08_01470 [Treponema sp.]|jgi:hypothetical protein|nr:hypothetical protein [Treponema sp.]